MPTKIEPIQPKTLYDVAYWVTHAQNISDCKIRISPNCQPVSPRQAMLWRTLRRLRLIINDFKPAGFFLVENPDVWSSQFGHRLAIPYGGNATRQVAPPLKSIINYGGLACTQATVVAIYELNGETSDGAPESTQASG